MLAVNAEVFCRHSFGSRYAGQLIGGLFTFLIYVEAVHAAAPQVNRPLLTLYFLAYLVLAGHHVLTIRGQRNSGVHSKSNGQSWMLWQSFPFSRHLVQQFIEPGLLILAGMVVSLLDGALALWLIASGICHSIKDATSSAEQQTRVLDAIDARIDGEQTSQAVREGSAGDGGQQAEATTVTPATQAPPQRIGGIREMTNNLDPALQRLMSERNPGPTNATPPPTNGARLRASTPPARNPVQHRAGPLGSRPRITVRPRATR